mmetsp:Transcript_26389/g.54057  ORF Transcript_26389/g.54057 Transcript_26389/m.54057 type:complete len:121 (-) Transcript_26389:73-435(-)|eukprot:CAMPEP_0183315654 /NCGR_PEP_ID=MMETSP0160_2-20130417/52489_1 /TAXON_ID=2839 ORGANISM="Odontella Sinensis, Strain Grunow 1884" /NCGR_SAMPLE_ID=MMETSP0160_2 /ASSEMBLY_ACC=CAM_ASM_000250 /LENGTH=120 /DNA_ID=CAMNT_0025481269 /DNA_START=66 /DNA_END=428 /DNA_ORIENTATION=-
MAEDLADAIVRASERMRRNDSTFAAVLYGYPGDRKLTLRDSVGQRTLRTFHSADDAFAYDALRDGYLLIDGQRGKDIMDGINTVNNFMGNERVVVAVYRHHAPNDGTEPNRKEELGVLVG